MIRSEENVYPRRLRFFLHFELVSNFARSIYSFQFATCNESFNESSTYFNERRACNQTLSRHMVIYLIFARWRGSPFTTFVRIYTLFVRRFPRLSLKLTKIIRRINVPLKYIFFFKQLSRTIRPRPTTNNFHSTQSCLLEKSFWHRIRRSFENGARRRVDVQRFSRSSSARRALTLYSSPTET